jgi:2',3'-cyclic-nucleotide 2'-phosphodiesterase (5'-nucleotidase family)
VFSRREFLQVAAATAALVAPGWTRGFAQQRLTQDDLFRFEATGNVTLLHFADLHAQLLPVYSASRRSISAPARRGARSRTSPAAVFSPASASRPERPPPMR